MVKENENPSIALQFMHGAWPHYIAIVLHHVEKLALQRGWPWSPIKISDLYFN